MKVQCSSNHSSRTIQLAKRDSCYGRCHFKVSNPTTPGPGHPVAMALSLQAEIAKKAIGDYFTTSQDLREKLKELQQEINGHHTRTNAFRTGGGVVVAIAGGVCLALAPFTGGTSLLVGGGIAAGAGAATGIGSTIGGIIGDRDHVSRLQDLAQRLQTQAEALVETVVVLIQVAAVQKGLSVEEIARTSIGGLAVLVQIGVSIFAGVKVVVPVATAIVNVAKMTPAMLQSARAAWLAAQQTGIRVVLLTVEGAGPSVVEMGVAASAATASNSRC